MCVCVHYDLQQRFSDLLAYKYRRGIQLLWLDRAVSKELTTNIIQTEI